MKTPRERLSQSAFRLQGCREKCAEYEKQMQHEIAEVIASNPGGMRDWARQMGISAQYACDLVHGRRKVSDAVVTKVMAL